MALRRQVGAAAVEIDTEAELLRFVLSTPSRIDFAKIQKSVDDAGYTLKQLSLELAGEVVSIPCEICARDVAALRVSETGQQLELTGEAHLGETGRANASVSDWAGTHPLLTIQEWQPVVR